MYGYDLYSEQVLTTPLSRKINTFNANNLNLHINVTFSAGQTGSVFVVVEHYDVKSSTAARIATYEIKPTDASSDLIASLNKTLNVCSANVTRVTFINNNVTSVTLTSAVNMERNIPSWEQFARKAWLYYEALADSASYELYVGDCEGIMININCWDGIDLDFCCYGSADFEWNYTQEFYGNISIPASGNSGMWDDGVFIPTTNLTMLQFDNLSGAFSEVSLTTIKYRNSNGNSRISEVW